MFYLLYVAFFATIELCLLCLIFKVLIAVPCDVLYITSLRLFCQHFFVEPYSRNDRLYIIIM